MAVTELDLARRHTTTASRSGWLFAPAGVLLFILPFSHLTALRMLALALTLAAAVYTWRRHGGRPLPCAPALLLWLAVAVLSLWGAVDPAYSLGQIKAEIGYGLAALFSFYVLVRQEAELDRFLRIACGSFLLAVAVAAAEYHLNKGWRETGYAGGVGLYSTYLVMALPLVLLALRRSRWALRWPLAALGGGLAMYGGLLARNLMLWPALLVQAATYLLCLKGARWRTGVLLLVAGLAIAAGFVDSATEKGRMHELALEQLARVVEIDPRPELWRGALGMVAEHPVNGVGFGRGSYELANTSGSYPSYGHAHNLPISYMVQMGLPGLAVYLVLFGSFAWRFARLLRDGDPRLRVVAATGLAAITGMLAKNFTDDFFIDQLSILYWATMGALLGYADARGRRAAASGD